MRRPGLVTFLAVLHFLAAGVYSLGILAFVLTRLSLRQGFALAGGIALLALCGVALLERAPYERQPVRPEPG